MPRRNKYFDFLRGIAIISVVGIHTYRIPDDFSNPLVYVAGREMLIFAVPLFLVISDLFSMRSFRQKCEYFSYLKKQIPKVYIPTIIWSLPWFVLSLLSGEDFIVSLLYLFTCGFSIFYFIALIIQMYLLLPVYHTVANNMGG